jgi:hypothetical protein
VVIPSGSPIKKWEKVSWFCVHFCVKSISEKFNIATLEQSLKQNTFLGICLWEQDQKEINWPNMFMKAGMKPGLFHIEANSSCRK